MFDDFFGIHRSKKSIPSGACPAPLAETFGQISILGRIHSRGLEKMTPNVFSSQLNLYKEGL